MRNLFRPLFALALCLATIGGAAAVGVAPVQAATTCQTKCLRVLTIKTYDYLPGKAAQANVLVVDENGGGIRGVVVEGAWTLPDDSVVSRYARIATRGRAEFPLVTDQYGTATFEVTGMSLAGYTFDPAGSAALSVSMNIGTPPASCTGCVHLSGLTITENAQALVGEITVLDEGGTVVAGAQVTATWTRPNGRTVTKTAITNRRGIAKVRVRTIHTGMYGLQVDGVVADGLTYDPGSGTTIATYTIN